MTVIVAVLMKAVSTYNVFSVSEILYLRKGISSGLTPGPTTSGSTVNVGDVQSSLSALAIGT